MLRVLTSSSRSLFAHRTQSLSTLRFMQTAAVAESIATATQSAGTVAQPAGTATQPTKSDAAKKKIVKLTNLNDLDDFFEDEEDENADKDWVEEEEEDEDEPGTRPIPLIDDTMPLSRIIDPRYTPSKIAQLLQGKKVDNKPRITLISSTADLSETFFKNVAKNNLILRVERDLKRMKNLFKHKPDVWEFFENQLVSRKEKLGAMEIIAQEIKMHPSTSEFVAELIDDGKSELLLSVAKDFELLSKSSRGIVDVLVTIAKPMKQKYIDALRMSVESFCEADETPNIKFKIDPKILDGYIIRFYDNVIDQSIATKIKNLDARFAESKIDV